MNDQSRIAFLSMHSLEDFVCDDDLMIPLLRKHGISVELVDWQAETDWDRFDLVVIRSTWNYQDFKSDFLAKLAQIENSSAKLLNSLDVVRWNVDKIYLRELAEKDVAIVPTIWFDGFNPNAVSASIENLDWETLICKPNVSANADDTFRFPKNEWHTRQTELQSVFENRQWMLQPFVESILTQGEFSLFYVDGQFTHAISKSPKTGDFRVQEEHGGLIESFQPPIKLIELGATILSKIPFELLYARVDFVEYRNQTCVMEIELIEPSFYFRFSPNAVQKFANAIATRTATI